jgi:hypothetical protein
MDKEDEDQEAVNMVLSASSSCYYAIRVQGYLNTHWSEWLEGMTITHEEGGTTRIEGLVQDQSALHGLLKKLGNLQLPIVALQCIGRRRSM